MFAIDWQPCLAGSHEKGQDSVHQEGADQITEEDHQQLVAELEESGWEGGREGGRGQVKGNEGMREN